MAQEAGKPVAKPLLGKVKLAGIIRTLTGLHIGASKEILEIGALDLPVVRDPVTQEPYIPGSSLKGKMRSLLERKVAIEEHPNNPASFFFRNIGTQAYPIKIHVCPNNERAQACPVCRLFGSSAGKDENGKEHPGSNFPSRLKVRDAYLTPYTRETLARAETGLLFTEIKFENALDRITAAANPRRIERVPPGSDFRFELIYDVEEVGQLQGDLENLFSALRLLEEDALGGHGSRGSGKVAFYVSTLIGKKAEAYRREEAALITKAVEQPQPGNEGEVEKLLTLEKAQAQLPKIVALFTEAKGGGA